MVAFITEDGQRMLEELDFDDVRAAVEHGRRRLEEDPYSAKDGVLAYKGRLTWEDEKLDAIILELRAYGSPGGKATMAVPYTPVSSGQFRVHRPKLVEWERSEDFDPDAVIAAFFQGGVEGHEEGAKVWATATTDR
jgi:hypothetical protein